MRTLKSAEELYVNNFIEVEKIREPREDNYYEGTRYVASCGFLCHYL